MFGSLISQLDFFRISLKKLESSNFRNIFILKEKTIAKYKIDKRICYKRQIKFEISIPKMNAELSKYLNNRASQKILNYN